MDHGNHQHWCVSNSVICIATSFARWVRVWTGHPDDWIVYSHILKSETIRLIFGVLCWGHSASVILTLVSKKAVELTMRKTSSNRAESLGISSNHPSHSRAFFVSRLRLATVVRAFFEAADLRPRALYVELLHGLVRLSRSARRSAGRLIRGVGWRSADDGHQTWSDFWVIWTLTAWWFGTWI